MSNIDLDKYGEGQELDPMCFKGFPMAITNKEVLLPCCYLDSFYNMERPEMQKLIKVSNLNDHDSIEEILLQPEWQEFYHNLTNHKGPPACFHTCSKSQSGIRKDVHVNSKSGKVQEKTFGANDYRPEKVDV